MPGTMSKDDNWDVEEFREEHESDEHWELRKNFMQRWKGNYTVDRLVCLGRVFANMELMGCRYPPEVMREVALLSEEIAKSYRQNRKGKLQRTFVSASVAAEDRAKGVKREGGVITEEIPPKTAKVCFVAEGSVAENILSNEIIELPDSDEDEVAALPKPIINTEHTPKPNDFSNIYIEEMQKVKCLDVKSFKESMFLTPYGRLVLLIRSWNQKFTNIVGSCLACRLPTSFNQIDGCFSFTINGILVAQVNASSVAEARNLAETIVWNKLREQCVSIVIKKQWIAQDDTRITSSDVAGAGKSRNDFGSPIKSDVATKMMTLMGWKGGGLGADSQGISEPIKPHLQMVNRAGLGAKELNINQFRNHAKSLMHRYLTSDCLDIDLVFSSEFSKEERAALHKIAHTLGLASNSYGKGDDRFLVVTKKLDVFSLVRAAIEKGGVTPKYHVFVPRALQNRS